MKFKHALYITTLLFIFGNNKVSAQGTSFDNYFATSWDINVPLGDAYVTRTSLAGFKLEYQKMILDNNFSVGADVSWNAYKKYEETKTYKLNESTDVTTDLIKYNYTIPFAATVHYNFPTAGYVKPYIGLGLGANYATTKLFANIYEYYDDNWGFLVRPEVGAIIKMPQSEGLGLLLAARYSYSTNESSTFKFDNLQALGFQIGLAFMVE